MSIAKRDFSHLKNFPGTNGNSFDVVLRIADVTESLPGPVFALLLLVPAVLIGLIHRSWWAAAGLWLFSLCDWALLAALPRFGRSFGPAKPPTVLLAVLRPIPALLPLPLAAAAEALGTLLVIYGFWIEPLRLGITYQQLRSPKLAAGRPLRVLHLGAGALTLARYVAATRPGSSQLAVEVDAALVDFIRRRLPGPRVRARIGDARAVLERLAPGSFDVVIADVFEGGRTPAHLTSAEFWAAARRAVGDTGVVAANVADGAPLAHARAQVATARTAFAHACLIADAAVLRGRRFGNLVLAASPVPLPVDALTRRAAGDPMPGRVADLVRFTAGARPVTDATAAPSPEAPPGAFAI